MSRIARRNLYPCSIGMRNLGTSAESAGTGLVVMDGVAVITPGSSSNAYVSFRLIDFPLGVRLTFSCELEYLGAWNDNDNAVVFYGPGWSMLAEVWRKKDGTRVRRTFTLPVNGNNSSIRFRAFGEGLKVSRISIEPAETFNENPPFYTGGTMPLHG